MGKACTHPWARHIEEGSVPIRKSIFCDICTWREGDKPRDGKGKRKWVSCGSQTLLLPRDNIYIYIYIERERGMEAPKTKGAIQSSQQIKEKAGKCED